jgi:hypothetical protein
MRRLTSVSVGSGLPAITALLATASLGFWILGIPGDANAAYAGP